MRKPHVKSSRLYRENGTIIIYLVHRVPIHKYNIICIYFLYTLDLKFMRYWSF